jgi:hypothetical protein
VECIHVVKDTVKWRTLVDTIEYSHSTKYDSLFTSRTTISF